MIRRAFQTCDELMFKVLRNLSQQDNLSIKRRFGPYVEQLVTLLRVRREAIVGGSGGVSERSRAPTTWQANRGLPGDVRLQASGGAGPWAFKRCAGSAAHTARDRGSGRRACMRRPE